MQAKKAISSILRYQKHFGYFQPVDAFKLFDTMVKPLHAMALRYGAINSAKKPKKYKPNFANTIQV